MKKVLSFVLALVMLIGLLPMNALAADTEMLCTDGHSYANGICTACGDSIETMALRYDDHVDMSGKVVEIIDAGIPISYQVGYGVEENAVLDTAVVTLKGNSLVATGVGAAKVRIDGVLYDVEVTAAPISLLLIIGQSNAEGMVGRAHQSIACENGQVYSTYAEANGLTGDAGLTVDNAGNYVPSALTGAYSTININGTDSKLSNYPVNSLTEEGAGKYGMDSGIAYEWVQQTGEKVWVVNAAHGASSISSWQPGGSNFEEAVALMDACQDVLRKEIAAGHFVFSHMGYYWCQGCADETKSAQWYVEQYVPMHEALKVDMAFDADLNPATTDVTMEFGGIILVMAGHENATGYRKGVYSDSSDSFFASFKELEMRGPRVAQIWMASNPELSDIHLVCTLAQDWVTMPDGNDGVAEYFASHYENGVIDYPTQVKQSTSWYSPTTPANVKNSIHYYQVGYNEVGRESVRNTLYILGVLDKPNVDTTVSFVDWTGYQIVDSIMSSGVGSSDTLVVPLVSPCYESKTVTYTLSDGLSWNYYDLLDTGVDGGTLTASIGTQTVAVTDREYYSYRFELVDGKMESVSNDTFQENLLTATAVNTYTLENTILLKHDKEWIVEFNSVAADRFMALASSKSSTDGMFYFFKSKSGSGVLSIGEYKGGLYQNYGLKQSQINVDWTQPHVYRFQNVISDDGTNTIHISVDGEWVGTATNLIINDVLQSTDNRYLSGKDFSFSSIGCGGFGLGAGQMTYLAVYEVGQHTHSYTTTVTAPSCTEQGYTTYTCDCGDSYVDSYVDALGHDYENGVCTACGDSIETMALRYDDHVDMAGKGVEIIDAGTPTSYQVGYGVEENAVPDTAVVTLENDTLVATGIGTAIVEIDGEPHEITVTAAPISLLLLIGQSNMEGNEGDANQSIVCPDGMVYATYGDRYDMDITNATHYAPSALTGQYREINTVGGTDGLSDYPVYMLTDEGDGRKGPDSGFAYEWVRQTGEKVWIVNASHGGTSLNVWQPGTTQYEECQAMFGACAETLRREIAAGHFTLSHMGYFWCQGCNDWDKTAEWYVNNYLTMHESLKTELAFDHDSDETTEDITFEFGGIIPVRAGHDWRTYYREGVYTDTTTASYYESFKDLQMSGPRVAQYWMGNNPELTEIWNVCTIGEDWVWMPDGTNGVAEYFNKHYVGGTVDYETQVQQEESWYTPTTPAAVHDSIHYNQIGYNEVGREAVRNALIYMGINPDYEEKTTVRFVDWTGYREVTEISALTDVGSGTLVVPIVSPITRCKDVTYSVSEGLHYTWYDLTADAYSTVGTLTAVGVEGQVAVHEQEPGMLYAEYLNELPERFCAGTNLWPVLEHNAKYYTVNGWGIHSSNKVFSVTIPVQAGDRIWATSMGANGVNGNTISSGHGIRVTFFSEYGVICSLTSDAVYAEFSANGYLTAPEGTTAVNIPMWNNGDDNELYILNRPHIYGDWYESAGGEERRDCSTCEHYETRKVSVAVVGETEYFSLDAAIEAAAAIKGTVTLLTNLEVPGVFIPKGVTLDLADFTLTTGYLIGLKGSCLTAVPNAGKLIVGKDSLFLSAQGYQNASGQYILPIWDPEQNCYLFSLFVVNTNNENRGLFIDEENETIRFQFKHQATGDINKGLLGDGSSDNALKVIVRLVWESENGEAYQDFVYNDGFVKKVAVGEDGVSYDYSFTLTGYSAMNIKLDTLKVVGMIITDSGAVASGTVWTAETAK